MALKCASETRGTENCGIDEREICGSKTFLSHFGNMKEHIFGKHKLHSTQEENYMWDVRLMGGFISPIHREHS